MPQCGQRSSLPLPVELTQRILFLVSEPDPSFGRIRYKFNGERRPTHQPPTNIQNARLVCRSFAALGAPYLFNRLLITTNPDHLAHARHVAQHAHFAKAIRTLVYEPSGKDWDHAAKPPTFSRDEEAQDDDDAASGPDASFLASLLPSLPAATRAVCTKYDSSDPSTRPLYALCAALRTSHPHHSIRALDLRVHVSLLADEAQHPQRFAALCAAFAPIRDLALALCTEPRRTRDDDGGGGGGAEVDRVAAVTALVRSGALGRLVGSASRHLTRLKLNLAGDGRRRSGGGGAWRFDAPLAAYVGAEAAAKEDSSAWPHLRYLYLGCLDVREDEVVPFLLRRRRTVECVEFDRVTLTQGSWAVVGAVVEHCLPWRWKKQHNLKQVEPKRAVVPLPDEVVAAVREALGPGTDERYVPCDAEYGNLYYFEPEDVMSTLSRG